MLSLLRLVSARQEHKYRSLLEKLATEIQITDEERNELLASGNQAIFDNGVGWAKTHLKRLNLSTLQAGDIYNSSMAPE